VRALLVTASVLDEMTIALNNRYYCVTSTFLVSVLDQGENAMPAYVFLTWFSTRTSHFIRCSFLVQVRQSQQVSPNRLQVDDQQ